MGKISYKCFRVFWKGIPNQSPAQWPGMQKKYLLNDTAYFLEKAIEALDTQIKAKHDYIFSLGFWVRDLHIPIPK